MSQPDGLQEPALRLEDVDREIAQLLRERAALVAGSPAVDAGTVPAQDAERVDELVMLTRMLHDQEALARRERDEMNRRCADAYDLLVYKDSLHAEEMARARRETGLFLELLRTAYTARGKAFSRQMLGKSDFGARVQRAGLFDAARYLSANPDVREAGVDPLKHLVFSGFDEGRLEI
ncbi:hypothetical protein MTR62_15990 [Novosphingobium sp. 1949]|uniref:Uncharacterized protein n=1 Tax=Novosphingobium organovorum TaxID=2930092 RepID=A0ABT0BGI5_9SPHN|nr:hypothetical protein [Novosphingobium organovorum]MCJ2184180.1 hypothetical protein [Novosphingobium organovorum]